MHTSIFLPSTTVPCSLSRARSASALFANVTKPNPCMQGQTKQHALNSTYRLSALRKKPTGWADISSMRARAHIIRVSHILYYMYTLRMYIVVTRGKRGRGGEGCAPKGGSREGGSRKSSSPPPPRAKMILCVIRADARPRCFHFSFSEGRNFGRRDARSRFVRGEENFDTSSGNRISSTEGINCERNICMFIRVAC